MSTWVADSLGLMNKAAVNMTCILAVHTEHVRLAVKVTALPAVQMVPDRAYSRYTPASAVCGLWMLPVLGSTWCYLLFHGRFLEGVDCKAGSG